MVLDEAQAVKNASTAQRQGGPPAARRAPAGAQRHAGREPPGRAVEPVRVPQSRDARRGQGAEDGRRPGAQSRARKRGSLLAHALRPFILRRTKQQVARELPPKTEQTIFCELEPQQRKQYDELRESLPRDAPAGRVQREGLGQVQDARAGSAAAPAPGGLPSRPARQGARRRAQRQARRPARAAGRDPRGGPQGAGLLAVHEPAGDRPRAPRRSRRPLRVSGRHDARPAGARRDTSRTIRTAACS